MFEYDLKTGSLYSKKVYMLKHLDYNYIKFILINKYTLIKLL